MRCVFVPLFAFSILFMYQIPIWGCVVPALIYIITGLTDMLDGKIARKYNLVTDFGKFIDPLADKFMVIGAMFAVLAWMLLRGEKTLAIFYVFVCLVILLRELGVTSLRLVVAGKEGIVVAASFLGKMKTVSQMVGTVIIVLEPVFQPVIPFLCETHVLSYFSMVVMTFTTLFSGYDYLKTYLPHIDSNH